MPTLIIELPVLRSVESIVARCSMCMCKKLQCCVLSSVLHSVQPELQAFSPASRPAPSVLCTVGIRSSSQRPVHHDQSWVLCTIVRQRSSSPACSIVDKGLGSSPASCLVSSVQNPAKRPAFFTGPCPTSTAAFNCNVLRGVRFSV